MNYININGILFRNQYVFRKNHSTSHALINLYHQISTGLDAKKHTVGIFLDLSKAYDMVDHEILSSKLDHYGICGLALDRFKNYLTHRLQYVEFNGATSMFKEVTCGDPQTCCCFLCILMIFATRLTMGNLFYLLMILICCILMKMYLL